MKFHYGGMYRSEADFKVEPKHVEGEVPFKEPGHTWFAIVANLGCIALFALLIYFVYHMEGIDAKKLFGGLRGGALIALVTLLPHEFLHATCFKEDVYLYLNPAKCLLFVHGTESMTKKRFVFMSMLPNIVFGLIPFVVFLFDHDFYLIGIASCYCIAMGFGDYINVFNALTQMPKGAKTFLSGFHSYWYLDRDEK